MGSLLKQSWGTFRIDKEYRLFARIVKAAEEKTRAKIDSPARRV